MDLPHAMAHFKEGCIPSYLQALAYSRHESKGQGTVATLLDIINARLAKVENSGIWHTTTSEIYFGLSDDGNPTITVIHGGGSGGPLSNPEILKRAYGEDAKLLPDERTKLARVSNEIFRSLGGEGYSRCLRYEIDARPYLWNEGDLLQKRCVREVVGKPKRQIWNFDECRNELGNILLGSAPDSSEGLHGSSIAARFRKMHCDENASDRSGSAEHLARSGTPPIARPILTFDPPCPGAMSADEFWNSNFAGFLVISNSMVLTSYSSDYNYVSGHLTEFTVQGAAPDDSAKFLSLRKKNVKKIHQGVDLDQLDRLARQAQAALDQMRLGFKIQDIVESALNT